MQFISASVYNVLRKPDNGSIAKTVDPRQAEGGASEAGVFEASSSEARASEAGAFEAGASEAGARVQLSLADTSSAIAIIDGWWYRASSTLLNLPNRQHL